MRVRRIVCLSRRRPQIESEVVVCQWADLALLELPAACLADGHRSRCALRAIFGRCLCCLLPLFVNRQLPCLHTNSRNVLLLRLMHHRNLWCRNERALGVYTGCR